VGMKTLFRRNVLIGLLAAALSLFALGVSATSRPCCGVKIRKDYIWLGHVTHLKPDELKDLENALRYADKSLYRVNFYDRGKLQRLAPIGTLGCFVCTTKELDEDAKKEGASNVAFQIGELKRVGHTTKSCSNPALDPGKVSSLLAKVAPILKKYSSE
jgi:hypothetical protein